MHGLLMSFRRAGLWRWSREREKKNLSYSESPWGCFWGWGGEHPAGPAETLLLLQDANDLVRGPWAHPPLSPPPSSQSQCEIHPGRGYCVPGSNRQTGMVKAGPRPRNPTVAKKQGSVTEKQPTSQVTSQGSHPSQSRWFVYLFLSVPVRKGLMLTAKTPPGGPCGWNLQCPSSPHPPACPLHANRPPFSLTFPPRTPATQIAAVCAAVLAAPRGLLRKRRADRTQRGGTGSYQDNGVSAPVSPLLVLVDVSFQKLQRREPAEKSPWATALIFRVSAGPADEGWWCRRADRNSLRVLFTFPQLLRSTERAHWRLRDEVTLVAPAPFLSRLPTASLGAAAPCTAPLSFFSPGWAPCLLHPPSARPFFRLFPLLPLGRTPAAAAGPDGGTKRTGPRAHTSGQ